MGRYKGQDTFGTTFYTLKKARAFIKTVNSYDAQNLSVRRMSKKVFPRRKKRYHVGSYIDWLNFA